MFKRMLVVLGVLFAITLANSAYAAKTYVMEELNIPYWSSEASSINERGQIVGSYDDYQSPTYARLFGFILEGDSLTTITPPNSWHIWLTNCNNAGTVIGYYMGVHDSGLTAFSFNGKEYVNISLPESTTAWGINNAGDIVGYVTDYQSTRGFISKHNEISLLPTMGGQQSISWNINNAGQIVGYSETPDGITHACLWEKGIPKDIGPDLNLFSYAWAINNKGQVVGWYDPNSDGRYSVFLWEKDQFQNLGNFGSYYAWPWAINDKGQILIETWNSGYPRDNKSYVWENGEVTDLSATTIWPCTATSINNAGVIVGYITKYEWHPEVGIGHWFWNDHAVKWTPVKTK